MVSAAASSALTEQHRQRQLALRALIIRQILEIWPAFDIRNIDESWGSLQAAILALIQQGRSISGVIADAYYRSFREAENARGQAPQPPTLGNDWRPRALVSLTVTGPITAKTLVLQNRPDAAAQTLVSVTGAASRIVLNAGRETITSYVQSERGRVGYARSTSDKPCGFCAMLASRGPVYSQETAGFEAHDHCSCYPVPVFRSNQPWPGKSREFQKTWRETTAGLSGKDAVNAFRKVVEAS